MPNADVNTTGHGIAKRDWLPRVKDKVALELMRALKQTLDPNGILNPGKVLSFGMSGIGLPARVRKFDLPASHFG